MVLFGEPPKNASLMALAHPQAKGDPGNKIFQKHPLVPSISSLNKV